MNQGFSKDRRVFCHLFLLSFCNFCNFLLRLLIDLGTVRLHRECFVFGKIITNTLLQLVQPKVIESGGIHTADSKYSESNNKTTKSRVTPLLLRVGAGVGVGVGSGVENRRWLPPENLSPLRLLRPANPWCSPPTILLRELCSHLISSGTAPKLSGFSRTRNSKLSARSSMPCRFSLSLSLYMITNTYVFGSDHCYLIS